MSRFFIFLMATMAMFSSGWSAGQMALSAKKAECLGREIQLEGNVTLEHELGTLSSASVLVIPTAGPEGMRNPFVKMEKGVKIDWWDEAVLTSECAEFDFSLLKGKFYSSQDRVCYSRPNANRELTLCGKSMEFVLTRDEDQLHKPLIQLEAIDVEQEVSLIDIGFFQVSADHACYMKLACEDSELGTASFYTQPGRIDFVRHAEEELCEVTTPQGDCLHAKRITVLLPSKLIVAEHAAGDVVTARKGLADHECDSDQLLHYQCEKMCWDSETGRLEMEKDITLEHELYGNVTCYGSMAMERTHVEGEWKVKEIVGQGTTKMHYIADPSAIHDLTCYGTVAIHHDQFFTTLHSPQEENGTVLEANQLQFEDAFGKIYADKAKLEYGIEAAKPSLKKLILCGNVRLHNSYKQPFESNAGIQQYALADMVDYYPESKQMRFSSLDPTHRVLFFDRLNSLQVSAPRLTITRDLQDGKETLRGEGDVRFLFHEKEVEQFRRRFQMSPSG